ncbi:MAG: hypothetical protein MUP03_10940 [Anaerolineales bacterium]|nr:hypothetical protein [Anaerolineales bacterium]
MKPLKTKCLVSFLVMSALAACRSTIITDLMTKPGGVLYQDDFSNPTSGWKHLTGPGGIMDYDGGGYRILITEPQQNYWSTLALDFQNIRIEVDALKYAGPEENRIGLICRYHDPGNYYFFVISSDGYYALGKVRDGNISLLGQKEMLRSEAIILGLTINHLRADCIDNSLMFYVNDHPVAIAQDTDYAKGEVGLLAGSFDQSGVDVVFDNFLVIKP